MLLQPSTLRLNESAQTILAYSLFHNAVMVYICFCIKVIYADMLYEHYVNNNNPKFQPFPLVSPKLKVVCSILCKYHYGKS